MNKFLRMGGLALALVGSGCMATQPAHAQFVDNLCTQAEVYETLKSANGEIIFSMGPDDLTVFQNWIKSHSIQPENTFEWSRVDFFKNTEGKDYPILVLIYTQDIRLGVDCTYYMGFLSEDEAQEVINLVRGT